MEGENWVKICVCSGSRLIWGLTGTSETEGGKVEGRTREEVYVMEREDGGWVEMAGFMEWVYGGLEGVEDAWMHG